MSTFNENTAESPDSQRTPEKDNNIKATYISAFHAHVFDIKIKTVSAEFNLPSALEIPGETTCKVNHRVHEKRLIIASTNAVEILCFSVIDTGILGLKENLSAPNKSRSYDLPISTSDVLPLSYRRLVAARPLN